jgi:hypothetical protein
MKRKLRLILLAGLLLLGASTAAAWYGYQQSNRSLGEVLRYLEKRLQGHNKLEMLALPGIHGLRQLIERPVPAALPTLSKGVQPTALPIQRYDAAGKPLPSNMAGGYSDLPASIMVSSDVELREAMAHARPGTVIQLAPGTILKARKFKTTVAGTAALPIVVRAAVPGSAMIEFASTVGFDISHAYWLFENLTLRGVCGEDGSCEHAFHIYGDARSTVIRNNRLENFNAQIKVNGLNGAWPDAGLIQYNTLLNPQARRTHHAVTPIDIVGANDWVIADNAVSNFAKRGGNGIAYGMFVKGAGRGAILERNLVTCSVADISQPGIRIGISVGGGGTEAAYCRDKRCDTEHSHAIVRNNVVAHCNDSGIDVNGSNQTLIVHNTLINTAGISVRQTQASARIEQNLIDGKLNVRDQALVEAGGNHGIGALRDADALDLSWVKEAPLGSSLAPDDFCRRERGPRSPAGATGDISGCAGAGK